MERTFGCEKEWLIPAGLLTVFSAALAVSFIPSPKGLLPALSVLPAWMALALLISGIWGYVQAIRHRHDSPIRAFWQWLKTNHDQATMVFVVLLLSGANMIAFMWVKPLLNYLVPFGADPLLADLDRLLFFGHEPWSGLQILAFPGAGIIYHPLWFVAIVTSLLLVAKASPSPERSAVLVCYFALWSLAGPIIHMLLPAAGPIFYERLGYGDRFASINYGPETREVADYLWSIYASKSFGSGSGISAMPSMHVTMSTWTVIATQALAPRYRWLAAAFWALILALSVALGWHYVVDGIVGAIAALLCYRALLALFRRRSTAVSGTVADLPRPI